MAMHYGLEGLRTACGLMHWRSTNIRKQVDCTRCRRTLKFATEWFTTDPAEMPEVRKPRTHAKREGARP